MTGREYIIPKEYRPLKGRTFPQLAPRLSNTYGAHLLRSLGADISVATEYSFDIEAAADWASSGLMPLTGFPDNPPLLGPGAIPSAARGVLEAIRLVTGKNILPTTNGEQLLSERAAILSLSRQGRISANSACRLIKTSDNWLALNLARPDDWDLLPALFQTSSPIDNWQAVADHSLVLSAQDIINRTHLLGLPAALWQKSPHTIPAPWFKIHFIPPHKQPPPKHAPLVIDLSALWAGPLAGHLLHHTGARVIKVESSNRPDNVRKASPAFYNLINGGKENVALDLTNSMGKAQLKQLITQADIVIESSRPRALLQMGIDAKTLVQNTPGQVWISITGYGRDEKVANLVAFGDDAAVAAGAIAISGIGPVFCGDALADPLTGLHAALTALTFWHAGQGGLFDLSLHQVTKHVIQFKQRKIHTITEKNNNNWLVTVNGKKFGIQSPRIRHSDTRVNALGADTRSVLKEFGIPC